MSFYPWRPHKEGTELFVRLTPKSSHNRIQGLYYDPEGQAFLKISVTAPPVDGLANKALITFLADKMDIPKSSISLLKGQTDRYKIMLIHQKNNEEIQKKLLP